MRPCQDEATMRHAEKSSATSEAQWPLQWCYKLACCLQALLHASPPPPGSGHRSLLQWVRSLTALPIWMLVAWQRVTWCCSLCTSYNKGFDECRVEQHPGGRWKP